MLKNFRNGVLAQLVLLAFVGGSMNLHASPLTCSSTIALGDGGFVLDSQITSGTCVQVSDKLFGNFNFGNLPKTGGLSFSSNDAFEFVSITFVDVFKAGVDYKFGYEVQALRSEDVLSRLGGDIGQTTGTSSLLMTTAPAGTGTIDFTKTNNIPVGGHEIDYTAAQRVKDLTVTFEDFKKGVDSDASSVLNTLNQTHIPVPEPASVMLLGSGMLGLVSFRCRRFLKK